MAQVLVDESLLGWKEFEMEVVRDTADNAIIVCSIENVDPMGVHTGDSITVAPALTLTDKEYQIMRNGSHRRAARDRRRNRRLQRAMGDQPGRRPHGGDRDEPARVAVLGAGVQGHRLSRSPRSPRSWPSATRWTSWTTTSPRSRPPSFEPSIDYVVTKIPRFAFEKFPGSEPNLTTAMKSVGEAMAIGRTIHESLQKALASPGNRPDRL